MNSFPRRRSIRLECALAAALFGSIAVCARGEGADTPDVWNAGAFSASPAALLAAKSSSSGAEAETLILLCERRYNIDSQGRQTITDRLIYRVLDESAVDDWASVEAVWAPWYQEKPALRARVVTPDGKEHPLDPKTIAEEASSEGSRLLYGDRRRLRAPLPAVTAGSVVEQEIVTRETAPYFDAGSVSVFV